MDTLATFDPQLRQSWDHLLVPGPAQAELLASIPLESLFSFEFSADCLSATSLKRGGSDGRQVGERLHH